MTFFDGFRQNLEEGRQVSPSEIDTVRLTKWGLYPIGELSTVFEDRSCGLSVKDATNKWRITKPSLFKPSEMIARAVAQFRSVDSDPMQMGRNAGVYDALRIYPSTIIEVMRDIKQTEK